MKLTKRRKKYLIFSTLFLCFLLVFYLFIVFRGGLDLRQEINEILPEDTVIYISVNNSRELWDKFKQLPFYRQFESGTDFIQFLMGSERSQDMLQTKIEIEEQYPLRLDEDFFHTWFGKQLILAITEGKETHQPGIIFATRTQIGFEEMFAELILQNYPAIELRTKKYKQHIITTYTEEGSDEAFSYIRFGKTIVFSLMTADTIYLERIIDRYYDSTLDSLADNEEFIAIFQKSRFYNVLNYFHVHEGFNALKVLLSDDEEALDFITAAQYILRSYDSGMMRSRLNDTFTNEIHYWAKGNMPETFEPLKFETAESNARILNFAWYFPNFKDSAIEFIEAMIREGVFEEEALEISDELQLESSHAILNKPCGIILKRFDPFLFRYIYPRIMLYFEDITFQDGMNFLASILEGEVTETAASENEVTFLIDMFPIYGKKFERSKAFATSKNLFADYEQTIENPMEAGRFHLQFDFFAFDENINQLLQYKEYQEREIQDTLKEISLISGRLKNLGILDMRGIIQEKTAHIHFLLEFSGVENNV